jgi:Domain of unknown function (DUF4401)
VSEHTGSNAFIETLVREGVIPANAAPPPRQTDDRPWFVSALQGIAGWLAGLFVLALIAVAFRPSESGAFAIFGAFLLAGAFGIYSAARNSAFMDQLALAASIAGQVSLTIFFAQAAKYTATIPTACVAVMQCALVFVMPNRLARALAAFFACIAWALAIRFAWYGDNWDVRHTAALAPALIGWAVIWVPGAALCALAIRSEASWMARPAAARIIRPGLTGLLLALTFGTLASEPLEALDWFGPSGSTPQNWLVLWPLLNVLMALFAAYCAFRLRNKALLGIAIAAALLHVGQFYFVLGTTLVVKSIIMVVMGGALAGAGILLKRHGSVQSEGAV